MKRKRRTIIVFTIAALATTYFACNQELTTGYKASSETSAHKGRKATKSSKREEPAGAKPAPKPKSDVGFSIEKSTSSYSTSIDMTTKKSGESIAIEKKESEKRAVEPSVVYEKVVLEDAYYATESYEWGTDDEVYTEEIIHEEEPVSIGDEEATAGILTAGEINDFSKWELWKDLTEEEFKNYSHTWEINPENRITVQVKSPDGKKVVDAVVKLKDNNGEEIWSAKTDNTGKAELWSGFFDTKGEVSIIEVSAGGQTMYRQSPSFFHNGVNVIELKDACSISNNVDIAFMVDATGSMGDEINYLKAELTDIMAKVKNQHPELVLNLGSVFYRDHTDDYLTRVSKLSADISQTTGFIGDQSAGGGGDYPEAVEEGLEKAVNELGWSDHARARILFVVLDAPPHQTKKEINKIKKSLVKAAEQGVRIVPVTASGIDKSTEFLMRSMALATNGTYVFLTDHSGVGNPHIEPSTDSYEVELLNDLMIRLINQYIVVPTCEENVAEFYKKEIEGDTLLVESGWTEIEIDSANMEANIDVTPVLPQVNSLKFYPNPTHGDITLEVEGEIKEIFLADMSGKLMKRFQLNGADSRKEQINIGEFPSGTYVLQYLTGEKWNAGKLLLLH